MAKRQKCHQKNPLHLNLKGTLLLLLALLPPAAVSYGHFTCPPAAHQADNPLAIPTCPILTNLIWLGAVVQVSRGLSTMEESDHSIEASMVLASVWVSPLNSPFH